MESLKKELDSDRPSLVRRIVGEHVEVGQQFWRQCSLLLVSFLVESFIQGKCHDQETDLSVGFFLISREKSWPSYIAVTSRPY